jgi:hypothetical protein
MTALTKGSGTQKIKTAPNVGHPSGWRSKSKNGFASAQFAVRVSTKRVIVPFARSSAAFAFKPAAIATQEVHHEEEYVRGY